MARGSVTVTREACGRPGAGRMCRDRMCRGWRSPARAGINCAAAASGPGSRPAPKTSTAFPHRSWAEPCGVQLTPEPAEGHPPGADLFSR